MQKGRGETLLFLHGYCSKKESFYYSIEYFKENYRTVAPDFPGFGASSPLPAAWSVGDYCLWLQQFMCACGIGGAHIVAHSFGARVAIKLAASRPELVKSLVITGGAGLVKPRTRAYKAKVALYRFTKKFAPRFAERRFGSREYRALPPVMRASYKKIVNEDLREEAKKICAPALLIYGDGDTVTPADEEGAVFAANISGSTLKIIRGGHFCFCENYTEFNELVSAFLKGCGRER